MMFQLIKSLNKYTSGNIDQLLLGLPWWLRRESICLQCGRPGFHPWVGKIPWRRKWQSSPGLLPGKSHGQRSLVGYSPWGHKESDTTERLHYSHYKVNFTIWGDSFKRIKDHIYLPLIPDYLGFPDSSVGKESACSAGDPGSIPGLERSFGEGKGYLLQYCGLENSMDCIVHGIAKSRTRLSNLGFHFPDYLQDKFQTPHLLMAHKVLSLG